MPSKITAENFKSQTILKVSALKKIGIEKLEEVMVKKVWHGQSFDAHGILVSNVRHINALRDCEKSLQKTLQILQDKISLEFLCEEIKVAVNDLDVITGRNVDTDLLDNIFSRFCIGK